MKKFNFHNTYEERANALKTFKANDMDSRSECFNMLQDIIVGQGVGTRKVLEDLGLDDLIENEEFLNKSSKDAILEILDRVPSKDIRAYAANFKADDMAYDMAYDMDHDMDKAHDAERPEKKIIEITAADEARWEEVVKAFDAFKNKLEAQVREFLSDRDKQPEGALTLEDAEDVIYRYTVLAGKHAFDIEQMEPEEMEESEELEMEEPEVEAIEQEIPAAEEEDELEKLLAE